MSIILSDLVKEIDVLQRLVNKIKKRDCEIDVDCYWLTKKTPICEAGVNYHF